SQNNNSTFRRIQADAIGNAAVAVRIIRQHDTNTLLLPRRVAQSSRSQSQICDEVCPIRGGLQLDYVQLRQRIAASILLEADGAGQNAAIELRQSNVHSDVMRRKAGRRALPGLAGLPAEDNLQPGRIGSERSRALAFTRSKCGGV